MRKWYENSGPEGDVVISTRARLARNLRAFPFTGRMDEETMQKVVEMVSEPMVRAAGGSEFQMTDLDNADNVKLNSLVERHLISPQLANERAPRGVVLSKDESISVMINEEDHLRIQAMSPGLDVWQSLKKAETVDKLLENELDYAFDERLGYLTRCPTNLGTGLRISVMLHLPALTETGVIRAVIDGAEKLGFAVRGIYGEGSKAEGAIFQISNQITLGLTETELARQTESAVKDVIDRERAARQQLLQNDRIGVEDRVWRAWALLGNARRMSTSEAMSLSSDLRLGLSLGIVEGIAYEDLNSLLTHIRPAVISETVGELPPKQRDEVRARMIREAIG